MRGEERRYPFTRPLGWSFSRYRIYRECGRKYFHYYYAGHDPDNAAWKVKRLKELTSVPLASGNIVHEIIAVILERLVSLKKAGGSPFLPINEDKFASRVEEVIRSATGDEGAFSEVYYGGGELDLDLIEARVHDSLEHFLASERYKWLLERADESVDGWLIEPGGFGETRIDGMKAYVKVDFALPEGPGYRVFDWKTGRSGGEENEMQLIAYASWISCEYGVPVTSVRPAVVYLAGGYEEIEFLPNEDAAVRFRETVRSQTEEMLSMCLDREENLPRPKEDFAMTDDPKTCSRCNFRELCGRE